MGLKNNYWINLLQYQMQEFIYNNLILNILLVCGSQKNTEKMKEKNELYL